MENRHIFNRTDGKFYIIGKNNSSEAVLNAHAGSIFENLSSSSEKFAEYALRYKDFIDKCIYYKWLSKEGALSGPITFVDSSPHLKRAQIELTRFCNLKCPYCYSESGIHQKTKLTKEKIYKIIDELVEIGCMSVDFTGGEPLLHKDWIDILSYANNCGLIISLHSNGTLFNDKNIQILKNLNLRIIQVSLDSHFEEVHNLIRGAGSFRKTVSGIKHALNNGLNIIVSVAAHKKNVDHYRETVEWVRTNLRCKVLLDRVIKAGYENISQMGIDPATYYELIAPLLKRNFTSKKICSQVDSENSITVEPSCGVAHSFVYITSEGEVALCPTMTSRDHQNFRGPSLYDDSLYNIWYSSPYFNMYRFVNCKNINTCPTSKECTGGCRSNAYIENGFIDSPDIVSCNIHKNSTPKFIDYSKVYSL